MIGSPRLHSSRRHRQPFYGAYYAASCRFRLSDNKPQRRDDVIDLLMSISTHAYTWQDEAWFRARNLSSARRFTDIKAALAALPRSAYDAPLHDHDAGFDGSRLNFTGLILFCRYALDR